MSRPLRILLPVLAVAAAVSVGCGGDTATARVETVPAATAAEILTGNGDAILLDIRTPGEFGTGHLEDAINIDFYADDFEQRIGALDRDLSYVVYCRSGNRSGAAMELFRELSFVDVVDVEGGIVAWSEAGLPVVP